jgi:hypothetical protein
MAYVSFTENGEFLSAVLVIDNGEESLALDFAIQLSNAFSEVARESFKPSLNKEKPNVK